MSNKPKINLPASDKPAPSNEPAKAAAPNLEALLSATAPAKIVEDYQSYMSSRPSMQLVTKDGRKIAFAAGVFVTKNQALIDYLDEEIALGLRAVTKGQKVSSPDADPMEAIKAKHYEEFRANLLKEAQNKALGITRDLGDTDSKTGINPQSTGQMAN